MQNDSKATNECMSQPSIQLFAEIISKDAKSEAQSTKVEHEYLTILSEIGQDSKREDLEHLQKKPYREDSKIRRE